MRGRQQNSKLKLRGDRDKMIVHITSRFSKLAKKYNSRYESLWKAIHGELRRTLKFENSTNSYIHKQWSLLKNETHEQLWDFEI